MSTFKQPFLPAPEVHTWNIKLPTQAKILQYTSETG